MGFNRLPTIADYWSTDPTCSVTPVKEVMSLNRFRALRRYLHCEDNQSITDLNDQTCKIKTVANTLSNNFLASYNPSQQLAVDEMMVKYKGRKVHMPKETHSSGIQGVVSLLLLLWVLLHAHSKSIVESPQLIWYESN